MDTIQARRARFAARTRYRSSCSARRYLWRSQATPRDPPIREFPGMSHRLWQAGKLRSALIDA